MIRQLSRLLTAGLVATVFTACELTVPDFNNPSVEDLQNNPNSASIASATVLAWLAFPVMNAVSPSMTAKNAATGFQRGPNPFSM